MTNGLMHIMLYCQYISMELEPRTYADARQRLDIQVNTIFHFAQGKS